MYVHNLIGTGSYTTSTTNTYNKDFTYLDGLLAPFARGFRRRALLLATCDLLRGPENQ